MKLLKLDLHSFAHFKNLILSFNPKAKIHLIYGENEAGKSTLAKAIRSLIFGLDKKNLDSVSFDGEKVFLQGTLQTTEGNYYSVERSSQNYRKKNTQIQNYFSLDEKGWLQNLFFMDQQSILMGSKDLLENLEKFDLSFYSSIQGFNVVADALKEIEARTQQLYKIRGQKPEINQIIQKLRVLDEQKKEHSIEPKDFSELEEEINLLQQEKQSILEKQLTVEKEVIEYQEALNIYDDYIHFCEFEKKLNAFKVQNLIPQNLATQLVTHLELKNNLSRQINEVLNEKKQAEEELKKYKTDQKIHGKEALLETLLLDLKGYEKVELERSKINLQLENAKQLYKEVNLDLQGIIQSSITEKKWNKIKNEIYKSFQEKEISFELSSNFYTKLNAVTGEIKQLKEVEASLHVTNNQSEVTEKLKSLQSISQLQSSLKCFTNAKGSVQLKGSEVPHLVKILLNKKTCTQKDIETLSDAIRELMLDYQHSEKRVTKLKKSLEILKIDRDQSQALDFDQYFKRKEQRNLIVEKLNKWVFSKEKMGEFAHLVSDLKLILTKEDEDENLFLKFPDLITKFNSQKQVEHEVKDYKTESEKIKLQLMSLSDVVDNFFNLCFKEIQSLTGLELNKSSFIKDVTLWIENQKNLDQKKQNYQNRIYSLEVTEKGYHQELEKHSKKLKKTVGFLEALLIENKISVSLTKKSIDKFSMLMDQFFHRSKEVKDLSAQLILKISELTNYKKRLTPFLSEEEITQRNLNSVFHFFKGQLDLVKHREKNLFLIRSQEKKINHLQKEVLKIDSLEQAILSKLSQEAIGKTTLEESLQYYELLDKKSHALSLINSKLNNCSLKIACNLLKVNSSKTSLENKLERLNQEKSGCEKAKSKADSELGALLYKKSQALNISNLEKVELECQDQIFKLNESIKEYLLAKSTHWLIKRYIAQFQNRNQKNTLKSASDFFSKITDGSFTSLLLNFLNKNTSILRCLSDKKEIVSPSDLSEGSRDQLFLSLKLAFLCEYSKAHETLPVILDDILVNFDDTRALNFLNVLKKLVPSFQIIFLTHHKHVLKMFENHFDSDDLAVMHLESKKIEKA